MIDLLHRLKTLCSGTRLYFVQALSVEISYRFALLQQVAGAALGLVGLIFFWRTAGASVAERKSYSPALLTAYLLIAYIFPLIHDTRVSSAISSSIRFGKLSFSLLRPYPYLWSVATQAIAVSVLRLLMLIPVLAVLALGFEELRYIAASVEPTAVLQCALAILIGIVCNILIRMVFGLFAFDLTQTWGPELVLLAFLTLAGGEAYPLDLLPRPWFEVASWTPAFYMSGFPALVLLGRLTQEEALLLTGRGVMVSMLTLLVVLSMWRRGLRRYEAVGA